MVKSIYYVDAYVKFGEMPLFLLLYHDQRGLQNHCALLCSSLKLRQLLRQRKGFSDPSHYGRLIYRGHGPFLSEAACSMLKERYDFNAEGLAALT